MRSRRKKRIERNRRKNRYQKNNWKNQHMKTNLVKDNSKKIKLDEFTEAYIAAALWTTIDNGTPLDVGFDINDISEKTLKKMISDCQKFQDKHIKDIKDNLSAAGEDFWFTRTSQGAGFWDGSWPKEVGDRLTKASIEYGDVDLYVADDGKIYC